MTYSRMMDGLVLWLPMAEGAGTRVNDLSKYANNGVFGAGAAAPSWVTGREGLPSPSFDGGDYINCGSTASLNIVGAITISVQVNRNANPGDWVGLVDRGRGASANGGISLVLDVNRAKLFLADGVSPSPTLTALDTIPLNQDTRITATWDGTIDSGSMEICYDGILQRASEFSFGTLPAAPIQDLYIGRSSDHFDGILDDVRMYNRVLDPYEKRSYFEAARKI